MDSISAAQCNMREAYYGGAPWIVTSGSAWLIAALGLIYFQAPVFPGALTGALVEYIFGAIIFTTYKTSQLNQALNSQAESDATPQDGAR